MISATRQARRTVSPWLKFCPWWALFGNEDDGYFGSDSWRSGRAKTLGLAFKWWLRNPLHNLTWYVIGVADRDRMISGPFGDQHANPNGGWLWSITSVGRIRLPYVSYTSSRVKFYAGWRPSGAFGFKLARAT